MGRASALLAVVAAIAAYDVVHAHLWDASDWWDVSFIAAVLKSLQRLHVDPLSIYGTNCLKFADGDEEESRSFLMRELHIVQPKLIVPMGEETVAFLNSIEFPLADALEWKPGELQRFTATVDALVVPDIDTSLDEAPAKTTFWNAFKPLGTWWAELPPY